MTHPDVEVFHEHLADPYYYGVVSIIKAPKPTFTAL